MSTPLLEPLREEKPCLLCGGHETRVAYAFAADYYDHGRFETASWDGRESLPQCIVRCTRCDLLFARPSFRADALDRVYPEDLVEPSITFVRALEASRAKHQALLTRLREHLPLTAAEPGAPSVCDVGSRYGVFPKLAAAVGYDAFGIEYNAASVRIGQAGGAPILHGGVADLARILVESGRSRVDAFVLDDVLEHLVNPRLALQAFAAAQQPGNLLFLQQMDVDSLGHRLFGRHWYYLQPGAHMYYFSERTLRALLASCGYEVIGVERPRLAKNLRRTVTRTLPGAAYKLLRTSLARVRQTPHKPLYLTRRLRSADDMFLVIARKTAS